MKIFWCKNCLNMSTRPRIEFDKKGICNACVWSAEKKKINWDRRKKFLNSHLDKDKNQFNCLVPVSGGKDGSYVAYSLREKFNARVLCVTVRPSYELDVGKKNLFNFLKKDFDHVHITINHSLVRKLDKIGFEDFGQGYYGWMIAIHTAVLRIAKSFDINLVMYGEDGEVEYGGSTKYKYTPFYGTEYMKKIFLNNTYNHILKKSRFKKNEQFWFSFPEKLNKNLKIAHYSYFDHWDSYKNYLTAKKFMDLEELESSNTGTFTNFAQNDQELAALHYYLMYLKFGFGRATQDAGIEIRRGSMNRDQAKNLVKLYDGHFPEIYLKNYLNYFSMSKNKFFQIIDKHVNKKLFKKVKGIWKPNYKIL